MKGRGRKRYNANLQSGLNQDENSDEGDLFNTKPKNINEIDVVKADSDE